ncbi:MAG: hypothetical protein SFV32_03990 [Opitutaceae bacterium]|nr:hypothetical protein [Opitutaceae bacterium]
MTRLFGACVMATLLPMATSPSKAHETTWLETRWNGESAYSAHTGTWKAVVSLDRGRLVHFGPADTDYNFLASDATKDGEEGYGGHRVWFGPQQEWSAPWPPPEAWEHAGAARWHASEASLELEMPPSPDGWPNLVRVYRVESDRLVCGVRASGGTRPAQVMQILQTPPGTRVVLQCIRDENTQEWMRVLRKDQDHGSLILPEHVRRDGDTVHVEYRNSPIKLAFATQPITAIRGEYTLIVSKGEERGPIAATPDDGLYTQIYLGAPKHGNVVELEQLSPAFAAGSGGLAEMVLELHQGDSPKRD